MDHYLFDRETGYAVLETDDPSRRAVRNSNRYKIGEVARMLGITPEAIRYYERSGIIDPEKNPVSGYRYYSAWDINMLVRARTYRQQGFSMKEVVDIMDDFEPKETIAYLAEKEHEIRARINEDIKLMKQLHDDQCILEDAVSGRNTFSLQYRPPMHFLQSQIGYNIVLSHVELYGAWIQQHAAFVLPGGVYEGSGTDDVAYGLFVEDSKLKDVGFRNETEIRTLSSCLCLSTSFLSGSDSELNYSSFQFALDYAQERGWEVVGDPVSRIVLMTREGNAESEHGGGGYRSLHKLWIPIKGDVEVPECDDALAEFLRFSEC